MRLTTVKNTLLSAAAVVALSALPAAAATQTGDLSVTTSIPVSCNAPSPSGTLRLPFNPTVDLVSQSMASTKVTVTITCYGNPTISHVVFDNGAYRDVSETIQFPENAVRYMQRTDAAGDAPEHFLGYLIYATENPDLAPTSMAGGEQIGTGTGSVDDNELTFSEGFDGTFFVTGKVYESSGQRSAGVFGQIGSVPGGTYNDTVVMTVSYN